MRPTRPCASVRRCSPTCPTVSHRSAAWLHDIELVAEAYDFTAPRHVKPTLRGGRLIRAPLGSEDVTAVQGLPVTTVTRTLADLLRAGPRDEAPVAVESALTRRPSGGRTAHARERVRFNALAGIPGIRRILRFSARDVRARPEAVVRAVQAALADSRATGPPGGCVTGRFAVNRLRGHACGSGV